MTNTTTESLSIRRHPEVRNYWVAALASLVLVFGMLFGHGSEIGAVMTLMFGIGGLFLHWTAAPTLVIMLSMYFTLFPTGWPELPFSDVWSLRHGSFRVQELILTAGLLVYASCQYRLFGLLHQSIPIEKGLPSIADPIRRPADVIGQAEFASVLKVTTIAVLVGQFVWWGLTRTRFDGTETIPFVWTADASFQSTSTPGRLSPAASRFILLTGLVFFLGIILSSLFWYWRLRRMERDTARMILQDTVWNENRREMMRIETWRTWNRKKSGRQP